MSNRKEWVVGTRGSKLALFQTNKVTAALREMAPERSFRIEIIKTEGDKDQSSALSTLRNTQFFTKELDDAMLAGTIDIAVHSLKDIVLELPEGLCLAAVTERDDPRDAFLSRTGTNFRDMPHGSVIGTGSVRRRAFLGHARPDLEFREIRGNVDTRLRKLAEGQYDAIVLAACGMMRLGFDEHITELLGPGLILPAAGQGAIAVTARTDDTPIIELLDRYNHKPTFIRVQAERLFLGALSATCRYPLGVFATVDGRELTLTAAAFSLDGARSIEHTVSGPEDTCVELAAELAAWFHEHNVDELVQS